MRFDDVTDLNDFPSGRTLPPTAYYELEATDFKGRRWTASQALPDVGRSASGSPVVSGSLDSITLAARVGRTNSPHIGLVAFEDPGIPQGTVTSQKVSVDGRRLSARHSRDAWSFRCLATDFLFHQVAPDHLVLTVQRDSSFPPLLRHRIAEATQLVLGRPVCWRVVIHHEADRESTSILSQLDGATGARWQGPFGCRSMAIAGSNKLTTRFHKRLFQRYLAHTWESTTARHKLWGYL